MCASTSSSSRLLVYPFLFLVGPGPQHEIAVKLFRVVHWALQKWFNSNLPSTPRITLSVSPLSPYFLTLYFPFLPSFFLPLSCTRQTSVWTVPFLGLLNPSILFRLRYDILFHLALLIFSPIQPYQLPGYMAGNLFSGIPLTVYCHFDFLKYLLVLSGYIPSSAVNTRT